MKKIVFNVFGIFLIVTMVISVSTVRALAAKAGVPQTIAAGEGASFVVKEDNSLWVWGKSKFGTLGDGITTESIIPIKIMDDVTSVVASYWNYYVIKIDGSLWAWGYNEHGSLGDGTDEIRNTPVKIMDDVTAVSAGYACTYAIKTDNSLWAWGDEYRLIGAVPDISGDRYLPFKVMDDIVAISTEGGNALALKTDGSVWGWGSNNGESITMWAMDGKPGIDTTKEKAHIMDDAIDVSVGLWYSLILKNDGTLWYQGTLSLGRFDGTTSETRADGRIWKTTHGTEKIMDSISSIFASESQLFVIKNDGSLWGWGENANGELGDGTYDKQNKRYEPVRILEDTVFVRGGSHKLVLKGDGSVWAWGDNSDGQIGQVGESGREIRQLTPVKVLDGAKVPGGKTAAKTIDAAPTSSGVYVTTKGDVAFEAYNIYDNNYFKLRDVAYTLSDTVKEFDVAFDSKVDAIMITRGKVYTAVGGEMKQSGKINKVAAPAAVKVFVDGKEVSMVTYNIDGNNYFKLRDLGAALGFDVHWYSAENKVIISTD